MKILIQILLIVGLIVVAVGVVALLSYAAKKRRNLSTDQEFVRKLLPNVDCGMCGCSSCVNFAKCVVEGKRQADDCKLIKPENAEKIRSYIKPVHSNEHQKVAFIKCKGGTNAVDKFDYVGAKSCAIEENMHSGCKACKFACIGCGDCVKACRYRAIKINDRGTAEVIRGKCTGCGACVSSCPNGLISMTDISLSVGVVCNNQLSEPGIEKKCSVGCSHCGNCINICPVNAIKVENNVPVIDPEKCIECNRCVTACPNHCISRL